MKLWTIFRFEFAYQVRRPWPWLFVVVLLALNLASEVVSFSRVIDRIPPLRALDRAGCTPQRRRAR